MNFQRTWRSASAAAGFASACTKLGYIAAEGKSCANGIHEASVAAQRAAQMAKTMQRNQAPADNYIEQASYAANLTVRRAAAGRACHTELTLIYVHWVLRDLVGDREIEKGLRQAAGAAIAGGNEDLAMELLE